MLFGVRCDMYIVVCCLVFNDVSCGMLSRVSSDTNMYAADCATADELYTGSCEFMHFSELW